MRAQPKINLLGVELAPPSLQGLLRMLAFLLALVALVEVVDRATQAAWSSEASVALIVGAFSGFLLTECGASFARDGWRAFALLLICGGLVRAAANVFV